jgi:hypothetical protein
MTIETMHYRFTHGHDPKPGQLADWAFEIQKGFTSVTFRATGTYAEAAELAKAQVETMGEGFERGVGYEVSVHA